MQKETKHDAVVDDRAVKYSHRELQTDTDKTCKSNPTINNYSSHLQVRANCKLATNHMIRTASRHLRWQEQRSENDSKKTHK